MSLKSEIKVGSQFEFSVHGEQGINQKAVVTRFLSNREEGLGPEADFYIADCPGQAVQADGVANRKKVLWRGRGDPEAEMKIELLLWGDPICCTEVRDLL